MNEYISKLLKNRVNEEGLTLVEVVGAIVIIGILTAIAVPIFSKYQAEMDSQAMKADLQSAGILIEQEQVDNNGLFPKYLPNEIKDNPKTKGYAYTYSDDRTEFCLQANTPSGKWFVSDKSKVATQNVCTLPNVGEGSSTPWQTPNVPVPSFATVTNTWASNAPAANAHFEINPITCQLDSQDSEEWGGVTATTYLVKITNTTRGQTILSSWSSSTTVDVTQTGWLPGDTLTYQVQSKCTITSGSAYSYLSDFSPAIPGVVATFVVSPTTYTSTPVVSWPVGATAASYSAAWADAYCPAGTKQYKLDALQNGTVLDSTGYTAWATALNRTMSSSVAAGKATTLRLVVSCLLPDGRRFNSAPTDANVTIPLQPPSAPASINADSAYGLTTVLPNRLFWSSVTCPQGTPQYNLRRTVPGPVTMAGWDAGTAVQRDFVAGTTYTYDVQAQCVLGSLTSASTGFSPSVTFTAQFSIPTTPAVPANMRSDNGGVSAIQNDRLLWDAVTCDMGATPYYSIKETIKNGSAVTTTPTAWFTGTTYNIPDGWSGYGSTIGFQIQAKCSNASGSSPVTAWSGTYSFTTVVPTPSAPTGLYNDSWGNYYWAAYTGCPAGTSPQYRANLTNLNGNAVNSWSGWQTGTGFVTGVYQGYPVAGRATVKCVGPNASSAESGVSATTSWTAQIATPYVMTDLPAIRTGRVNVSCPAGASGYNPHIYMWTSTGAGYGHYWAWTAYINVAWGSPNARLGGWASCSTPYVISGEGYGESRQ